ncbi:MAG TPA: SulP family inorganic anion transporter [Firmicutes bacterium]|nr:SulP family inorganic anion transporter [Bacillota bacterium]
MQKMWQQIRGDVTGGATAALVALPLSLAFGIASGAGAVAGLYGVVFGGLVASVFGGCGVQITGPTGSMIGILVGIVSQHGVGGMFLAGVLAGLMQILFGLLRLGGFVKYLPQPVIAGFTNGVAIIFFMTALNDARAALSITVITAGMILLALRYFKQVPHSLFGLAAGLIANELFVHSRHVVGDLLFHLPKLALSLMPFREVGALLKPAFSICLLGSISALLAAEVADGMLGVQHNSNRELIGQGLGNLVSSLLGGLPVTGAVARSGVNVQSGGRTRLSGILHSVFILLMVLVFAPVVKRIPLASLAAVLMIASVRTVTWQSLKLIPRARWHYGAIMTVTTILTVVKDLTIAVTVGVVLAGLGALVEQAFSLRKRGFSPSIAEATGFSCPAEIQVLALEGPLFFVGVEQMRRRIRTLAQKNNLVLDFSAVSAIDETAALALRDFVHRLQGEGKRVYIGGLQQEPLRMLIRMGVVDSLGRWRVCKHLSSAVRRAAEHKAQEPTLVPLGQPRDEN